MELLLITSTVKSIDNIHLTIKHLHSYKETKSTYHLPLKDERRKWRPDLRWRHDTDIGFNMAATANKNKANDSRRYYAPSNASSRFEQPKSDTVMFL